MQKAEAHISKIRKITSKTRNFCFFRAYVLVLAPVLILFPNFELLINAAINVTRRIPKIFHVLDALAELNPICVYLIVAIPKQQLKLHIQLNTVPNALAFFNPTEKHISAIEIRLVTL